MKKVIALYFVLSIQTNLSFSQSVPVSSMTDNMVDLFTGDFNYQVPLLAIPGPNGENIPLIANYRGGIQMEQQASWIGLGWDFNPGEIIHQVNGVSDDWKEVKQSVFMCNGKWTFVANANLSPNTYVYGPLYYRNFEAATKIDSSSMDLTNTYGAVYQGNSQTYPDYDSYFVNAPDLSGEMTLRLLEYKQLKQKKAGNQISYPCTTCGFTKIPQFTFKGDFSGELNTPYNLAQNPQANSHVDLSDIIDLTSPEFENNGFDNGNPIYNSNYVQQQYLIATTGSPFGGIASASFVQPGTIDSDPLKQDYYGPNYNPSTNRLKSKNYVKYYTNSELSGSSFPVGFLDYDHSRITTPMRTLPDCGNLIGAIEITNSNGMVYHFSLPVYSYEEKSFSVKLNSSGEPDFYEKDGASIYYSPKPYIYSYKLTAITGVDYKDLNNNHIADIGDEGYWVSYSYGEWTSDFQWSAPFFNYSKTLILDKPVPFAHASSLQEFYSELGKPWEYKSTGNGSNGHKQIVYLNRIQTASHSAIFFKDLRADGISKRHHIDINPNDANKKPIPQLKLSRIVLLRNEDLSAISLSSTMSWNSNFEQSGVFTGNVYKIDDYLSNQSAINSKSLRMIEFATDYKLCNLTFDNINNSFTKNLVNYEYVKACSPSPNCTFENLSLYEKVIPESCANVSNRGKLTLNEIRTFEVGGGAINPSYKFEYTDVSNTGNPNYNPNARDYWGYYKSDRNSDGSYRGVGYLTHDHNGFVGSKNNVNAWSLRTILLPSGAKINVEYESDEFSSINYEAESGLSSKVTRGYLLKNLTTNLANNNIGFSFDIEKDGVDLFSSPELSSSKLALPGYLGYPGTNQGSEAGLFRTDNKALTPPTSMLNIIYNIDHFEGALPFTLYNWIGHKPCNVVSFPVDNNCIPVSSLDNFSWNNGANSFIEFQLSKGYGGGIRVRKIGVYDPVQNVTYRTAYLYGDGVASHEPDVFSRSTNYLNLNLASVDRDCPTPMVGYTSVIVKRESVDGTSEGEIKYSFDTESGRRKLSFTADVSEVHSIHGAVSRTSILRSFHSQSFGLPSKMEIFDSNGLLLSTKISYYQKRNSISELFHEYFEYNSYPYQKMNVRSDETFSLSSECIYKNGEKYFIEYSDWDQYTGAPRKIKSTDPFSGYVESQSTPAYLTHSSIGSKFDDVLYQNRLNFTDKSILLKGGLDKSFLGQILVNNLQMVDGKKTIYSDLVNIRKYSSSNFKYQNIPDPDHILRPISSKVYNGDLDENKWEPQSEITLLDQRGHVLETKTPLGVLSCNKYGYNSTLKITEAIGASYESCAFTSFEDRPSNFNYYGGEILMGYGTDIIPSGFSPHSGKKVVRIDPQDPPYGPSFHSTGVQPGRTYRASVWVYRSADFYTNFKLVIQLNGSHSQNASDPIDVYLEKLITSPDNILCGSWLQMNLDITIPADYTPINGPGGLNDLRVYTYNPSGSTSSIYIDDFSFRPVDATITNFVYDENTGFQTAVLNNENFASYFEYDGAGRLLRTKKETLQGVKKVSESTYNQFR